MNNGSWTPAELETVTLSWVDFSAQWQPLWERGEVPRRTYHGWRQKRADLHKKRSDAAVERPQPKPRPIYDPDVATDAYATLSDAELYDAVVQWADVMARAQPHTLEHSVRVPTDEPIAIAFPSDWHIGSEGCDYKRIRTDCALIASHPRLYCALGGDPVDNFILQKMGSAARSQVAQVHIQWRCFRYCVNLIADSLLWVSSGNHDAWTQQVSGLDGVLAALAGIPVVYTGEGGYIDVTVGTPGREQVYTVWRKHKPTRFNSGFNQTHYLKQMLRVELPREYDIGISEHLHTPGMETWTYRGRDRALITCGSYKVMDRWAESIGYYSGGYGVPTVVLYPDRRRILTFYSIADALEALDGLSSSSALSA